MYLNHLLTKVNKNNILVLLSIIPSFNLRNEGQDVMTCTKPLSYIVEHRSEKLGHLIPHLLTPSPRSHCLLGRYIAAHKYKFYYLALGYSSLWNIWRSARYFYCFMPLPRHYFHKGSMLVHAFFERIMKSCSKLTNTFIIFWSVATLGKSLSITGPESCHGYAPE